MDLDRDQNNVPGRVPNFGAIFMSNSATKRECLRRKLFGLPSSQAYFVKQVKAGMVLFLFEFERRELYGVFQACSDGAMNIVPHAFSSSGKQFPAQVKFTTIWYCSPLSEPEFHGAIKDNYFSANKFNFGLSADQVRQLLLLFSSRKLKDCLPQRLLMGSKVTKLIRNSLGKLKRVPDDDKLALSDREEIEHDVENDLGQVMLADYPWEFSGKRSTQ
ncbi:hypothetical protein L1049_010562 [Liquidambar formosana]|uniref:DCD domain-containing protein n=1 Tax=Liquidambar formosana TaxID=63359 RepID=A0AAP0R247_LIQFO